MVVNHDRLALTARRFSSALMISRGFGVSRLRFLAPGSDGSSLGSSSLKMEGTFRLFFLRAVGLSDAFGIESARKKFVRSFYK